MLAFITDPPATAHILDMSGWPLRSLKYMRAFSAAWSRPDNRFDASVHPNQGADMKAKKVVALTIGVVTAVAITVYAAGGTKRTAETCTDDSECSRGHCHTKKDSKKVCVDCTSSEISDYRGQIERFCKNEPRSCDRIPGATEVPEEFFNARIENGDRCIKARDEENRRCWDGGDSDHKDALNEAEKARKVCYDELNTRKGNGGIYTCSESTYSSRVNDLESACSGYGRGCDSWSKDDKIVGCGDIEDQMKKAAKCVDAVEKIDSDCLPRLSGRREAQFREGKEAYDFCKEVLDYKKDKKLCK